MLTPLRSKIGDLVAQVIALRPKADGGSTTLSANAAAGATTMTLTSVTGFTANDPAWVGSEEDIELVSQSGAPSGSVVTIRTPGFKRAHVSGEAARELEAFDLGNVVDVQVMDSATVSDNDTDVSRNPDGRRLGHLMRGASFDVQGYSPWLYALLTGMPLSRVLGAGTQADPTQLHTDGTDFGSEETGIVLVERLKDGTFFRHEFDACSADYTQMVIPFGQGRETRLQGRMVAANHGMRHAAAPPFLVSYTQQAKKGQQIEALLEAAYLRVLSGGLSTTLTGVTNKDANVFALTAATGVAGGKYYLVTGGGNQQVVLAQSVASLNMTVRTRAAYTFPAGSTVVELEVMPFAGLKQDTTEFRNGGAVRPLNFDNARVQAGHIAGSALFTVAFSPTARTLEMLRLQNGLPTSAISGTALTESDLAGTDAPVGWFIRAQRKDAKTVQFIGSAVDNGLETLQHALSKADVPSTPLTFRSQLISQLMW
jgi:hypothetical protein